MAVVVVCGGRDYSDRARVYQILDAAILRLGLATVLQGGATGADALAKEWARERNVPIREFLADWTREGLKAGPLRNQRMLDQGRPEVVIAFPGGAGTADMVRRATQAGVRVVRIV